MIYQPEVPTEESILETHASYLKKDLQRLVEQRVLIPGITKTLNHWVGPNDRRTIKWNRGAEYTCAGTSHWISIFLSHSDTISGVLPLLEAIESFGCEFKYSRDQEYSATRTFKAYTPLRHDIEVEVHFDNSASCKVVYEEETVTIKTNRRVICHN